MVKTWDAERKEQTPAVSELTLKLERPITLEQVRVRAEAIKAVAEPLGVEVLGVFGSVARGDAEQKSDLDLAVDWLGEPPAGHFQSWEMVDQVQAQLERLLGVDVHVVPIDEAQERVFRAICAETERL